MESAMVSEIRAGSVMALEIKGGFNVESEDNFRRRWFGGEEEMVRWFCGFGDGSVCNQRLLSLNAFWNKYTNQKMEGKIHVQKRLFCFKGSKVSLEGGYYDAGDHVKFGLPMAFAVTMLSWAAVDNKKELSGLNQMPYALSSIKWGTDYFIKAHPQPMFYCQVGDGESDNYCWERAEDMTTSRTTYKLDQYHPGSDLAGETASALAAASLASALLIC